MSCITIISVHCEIGYYIYTTCSQRKRALLHAPCTLLNKALHSNNLFTEKMGLIFMQPVHREKGVLLSCNKFTEKMGITFTQPVHRENEFQKYSTYCNNAANSLRFMQAVLWENWCYLSATCSLRTKCYNETFKMTYQSDNCENLHRQFGDRDSPKLVFLYKLLH